MANNAIIMFLFHHLNKKASTIISIYALCNIDILIIASQLKYYFVCEFNFFIISEKDLSKSSPYMFFIIFQKIWYRFGIRKFCSGALNK